MGLFGFAKSAGERLAKAGANFGEAIKDRVTGNAPDVKDLKVEEKNGKVVLEGKVKTQAEAEKAIIAAGNSQGVEEVESRLEVEEKADPAVFYTVKPGDSLSKIAKSHYGDAMRYPEIFEANKPMLSDPDKIYPGQVLRIPGA